MHHLIFKGLLSFLISYEDLTYQHILSAFVSARVTVEMLSKARFYMSTFVLQHRKQSQNTELVVRPGGLIVKQTLFFSTRFLSLSTSCQVKANLLVSEVLQKRLTEKYSSSRY